VRFDVITIFPEIFNAYLNESILKRAIEKKIIEVKIHNLRDFTSNKHRTVDDYPYGGGPGMVMKPEPFFASIESINSDGILTCDGEGVSKITLSGSWDSSEGTFNIGQSVVTLTGSGDLKTAGNLAGGDFYDLSCAADGQTTTIGTAFVFIAHTLTVGDDTGKLAESTTSFLVLTGSGDVFVNGANGGADLAVSYFAYLPTASGVTQNVTARDYSNVSAGLCFAAWPGNDSNDSTFILKGDIT